ncbi:MAG: hypothetical protein JWL59_4883 [Chthoniobacteraceae bacterium]|nr:hypothetical protein [Chthoniobacteraceae bacterium]
MLSNAVESHSADHHLCRLLRVTAGDSPNDAAAEKPFRAVGAKLVIVILSASCIVVTAWGATHVYNAMAIWAFTLIAPKEVLFKDYCSDVLFAEWAFTEWFI